MKTLSTKGKTHRYVFAIFLATLLGFVASTVASDGHGEYVVLANKDAPIEEIGRGDLARLYLSKTKQVDGKSYRVVNLVEDNLKQAFMSNLTSMSESELERHYIAMELRGDGGKPKEVSSSKSMIFLLMKSDKIIGWLPLDEYEKLSEPMKAQMRVIRIQ